MAVGGIARDAEIIFAAGHLRGIGQGSRVAGGERSTLEKTKVDVTAAQAKVWVSEAEERRLAALVGYLTIAAPYDSVVFARNVNTGDFILPATGDPTQGILSLGVSPSRSTPLYVLNRIDPVLFVVGVPEADAPYVAPGIKAV